MNEEGDPRDHPFDEVVAKACKYVAEFTFFQKFTCTNCGQRLTIHEPNKFYTHADCDRCGHVTDIQASGCNYAMASPRLPHAPDQITLAQTRVQ
jgi:rRNA maturation protein Nop10